MDIPIWVTTKTILPSMVHDLPLSFARDLDRTTTRYLKKWVGLFRGADVGTLYRSRERFGLGITKTSVHFKKMGVIKCLLLNQSNDANVRELYELRAKREASFERCWRATQETTQAISIVKHNQRFAGQTHRMGLGNGHYIHDLTPVYANMPLKPFFKLSLKSKNVIPCPSPCKDCGPPGLNILAL